MLEEEESEYPHLWKEANKNILEEFARKMNSPVSIPIENDVPYLERAKKFLRSVDLVKGERYQVTTWTSGGELKDTYRAVYTGRCPASRDHRFSVGSKNGTLYIGMLEFSGISLDYGTVCIRYCS